MADVDAQTITKLVKFLKRGKAPGPDTIHNEVLRLGTTTSLFHHLAIVPQLSKCLKFQAVWGVLTDQMI